MTNPAEQPQLNQSATEASLPLVAYGEGVDAGVVASPEQIAQTMRELGVSEQGISDTTVYMDSKSRRVTLGTHYVNRLGRLRFPSIPEIQQADGDIIRISTVIKGSPRTDEEMNRTLVHELEHRAQQDREDPKLTQGHIAVYGLALAGAIIGNRLGRGRFTKTLGTVTGAAIGHTTGYMVAPHERQARERARQVTSRAVSTR